MKALWIGFLLIAVRAFAHGDHHHGAHAQAAVPADTEQAAAFQKIGQSYLVQVKPIFQKKCFDCHSDQTHFPWYHSIPGIKQFLDSDVAEGRKHLDFSKDYPFISHATPIEDLDAIHKEVDENEMPPLDYRLMHSGAALTDEEKETVHEWVEESKEELQSP